MTVRSLILLLVASTLLACPQPAEPTGPFLPDDYVATAPQRIVFLGDATTFGRGASEQPLRYRRLLELNEPEIWPDWEEQDLESLFADPLEYVNVSQGATDTTVLVNEQLPKVAEELGEAVEGETLAVLTVGGRDLATGEAVVDDVIANLEQLVDFFDDDVRFGDGSYVYLGNIFAPNDGESGGGDCATAAEVAAVRQTFLDLQAAYYEMAVRREIALVDVFGHFLGHGLYHDDVEAEHYDADDPTDWFFDCKLPNDRGHHELRRLFFASIAGEPLQE